MDAVLEELRVLCWSYALVASMFAKSVWNPQPKRRFFNETNRR
jgi:hypothetical protein